MTDYEQVVDTFFATAQYREEIPDELLKKWFKMAVNDFSHDIFPLIYNPVTQMFDNETLAFKKTSEIIKDMLGKMIYLIHIKRQRSRINQLQNIVGRDIALNSTAQAKAAMRDEYLDITYEIEQLRFKLKQHAFN